MGKYQNKYRIPSARLQGYDYGAHGLYFVTICTKDRINYFGNIIETDNYPSLYPSEIGKIANEFGTQIPRHFPFIELDEFIIMPNHIHGILFFNKPKKINWVPNEFGRQSPNLGSVIRGFKSSMKRYSNQNDIDSGWQNRYHDRIIRNEKELENIREYIVGNPANWANDILNSKNNISPIEIDNYPSLHISEKYSDIIN